VSYDLVFWRQLGRVSESAAEVYARLLRGEAVPKVADLPVPAILESVRDRFPSLTADGGLTYWDGGDAGLFEFHPMSKCVSFTCRGASAETMNTLINLMIGYKCRLYDPQLGKRFDS
jgi:hypothetical protein